jgi:hypothetical protein
MTFAHPSETDDRGRARWQRWVAVARRGWAEQREAHERLVIMNRPWIHAQLHWVPTEDGGAELHGSVPPPGRSRGPVTRGGWCPCIAAERRRRRIDQLLTSSSGDA